MSRPALAELPDWPALMRRTTAAAYCDVSPSTFEQRCPIRPTHPFGPGIPCWRRADLDDWIARAKRVTMPTADDWAEEEDAGDAAARG